METQDSLYIVFRNRYQSHSSETNDYHLERILSEFIAYEIADTELDSMKRDNLLLITDDKELLDRYIFCLSVDDFKQLCGKEDVDKQMLRLDRDYFKKNSARTHITYLHANHLYDYFEKIQKGEIISAGMAWKYETFEYGDYGHTVHDESFIGWYENYEFYYFPIPSHYKNRLSPYNYQRGENTFRKIHHPQIGGIATLKKLINQDVLNLSLSLSSNPRWDYLRNGIYKFYDSVSHCRLFIQENILNKLKDNNSIEFKIETKLNMKDYVIEYSVNEIIEDSDTDDSNGTDFSSGVSHEKYGGYNGYDDDSIDYGFEGNPSNTWNNE